MSVRHTLLAALALSLCAVSASPADTDGKPEIGRLYSIPMKFSSLNNASNSHLQSVQSDSSSAGTGSVSTQALTNLRINHVVPVTATMSLTYSWPVSSPTTSQSYGPISQGSFETQQVEAQTAASVTININGQSETFSIPGFLPCPASPTDYSYLNNIFVGSGTQVLPSASSIIVELDFPYRSITPCIQSDNSVRIIQLNMAANYGSYYFSDYNTDTNFANRGISYRLSHNSVFAKDISLYGEQATRYVWVSWIPTDITQSNVCKICTITSTGTGRSAVYAYPWSTSIALGSTDIGYYATGSGTTVTCQSTSDCITSPGISTSTSTSSSSSSVCFHGDEKIYLQDGTEKSIEDAQVGDRVMVAKQGGKTTFAPIVYIPHAKNSHKSTFVKISTKHRSIKATPNHLIRAAHCSEFTNYAHGHSKIDFYPAKLLTVGMCVETLEGLEPVVEIEEAESQGLYTIVTADWDGMVVVNGIMASSFAHSHQYVNSYYHFHRVMYNLLPSWFLHSKTSVRVNNMIGDLAAWLWL